MTSGDTSRRAWALTALRGVWLSRALLPAALLVDVLAIFVLAWQPSWHPPAYFEWNPLVSILPSAVVLVGCALLGRRRPLAGSLAGALALVVATPLVMFRLSPYATVAHGLFLAEAVAVLQLIALAHGRLPRAKAVAATVALAVGSGIAIALREADVYGAGLATGIGDPLTMGAVWAVLIAAAVFVGAGMRDGTADGASDLGPYATHWPLIGGFALVVLFEFALASWSLGGVVVVLLSVVAVALAIVAARHPVAAGAGLAVLIVLTGVVIGGWAVGYLRVWPGMPLPVSQVMAGVVVTAQLVRYRTPAVATGTIAALWAAVGIVAILYEGPLDVQGVISPQPLAAGAMLLLAFAVAVGLYLRSRDAGREQVVHAAVGEAKSAERMALARELHDVVAHHVAGMVVQAQAAKAVGSDDPELTRAAFDRIETAGVEAMNTMRRLVGSIRSGERPGVGSLDEATTDLTHDLHRMVDMSGHRVPTELDLDLGTDLPQDVARSALRIVQESLTNIGKHAEGATVAHVAVGVADGMLRVRVSDDGRRRPAGEPAGAAGHDGGYGLVGMRERVELLHGSLSAGPSPGGGWVVEARLPLADLDELEGAAE